MSDYDKGFEDGLRAYAINRDGQQWVGSPAITLREAIDNMQKTWVYSAPKERFASNQKLVEYVGALTLELLNQDETASVTFDYWKDNMIRAQVEVLFEEYVIRHEFIRPVILVTQAENYDPKLDAEIIFRAIGEEKIYMGGDA